MITKLKRVDVEPGLRFTEKKLPRKNPPRVWNDRDARGELPELDEANVDQITQMSQDQLAAEALKWHHMPNDQRAAMLKDEVTLPLAARMANLHAKGFHLRSLDADASPTEDSQLF
jgi:hypothetical protein